MIRAKDGDFFITDWLRNRNTLEFIGIWEKVYNPDFNYGVPNIATLSTSASSAYTFDICSFVISAGSR